MFFMHVRAILGRLFVALLLLGLFFAPPAWAAALDEVAIYQRLLKGVTNDEQIVMVGDMGIKASIVRANLRRALAAEGKAPAEPENASPPGFVAWPSGVVPYQFAGDITAAHQKTFTDATAEWAMFANIQFIPRTTETDYVFVENQAFAGGQSAVGKVGGAQLFRIGSWNRYTLGHELGHTLGLIHEHQRSDRDTFVTILTQNIIPGDEPNFTIISPSLNRGAYDFYSIMHYSRNALSIDPDNLNTIEPQSAYSSFLNVYGQQVDRPLSQRDRSGMATLYGNPTTAVGSLVTKTDDSGAGSLRASLYYAFDHPGTTITFNIPTSSPGFNGTVFTITPTDGLFAPGPNTIIDASTEPGNTNPNGPEIVIDGSLILLPDTFGSGFHLLDATCTVRGFVINRFIGDGIRMENSPSEGSGATGNIVAGCYIGTDAAGQIALPNQQAGIRIFAGANNNVIGGTAVADRNVISGNVLQGVAIHDLGSDSNTVRGNYIGTDATGTAAIANGFSAVEIFGGPKSNVIGGVTVADRNILSGNTFHGILLTDPGTDSNLVEGNYIGLNATGSAVRPNGGVGIVISGGAKSNVVGSSTAAGARNIISGNLAQGVVISDAGTSSNKVQGNLIGLNPAGTAAFGNGFGGIDIFGGAASNTIGGTTVTASNFISGNGSGGVNISGVGTKSNKVQRNFIGTNLSGTGAVPNLAGVQVFGGAASNTIGGTTVSVRNVISGNNFQGVAISGNGTKSNTVAGNFIGTNKAGTAALPNTAAGISIFGKAKSNVIGGATSASRNIISGNLNQGVTISDSGTSSNQVLSNFIGTNAAGTAALANSFSGIDIFTGAASNIIGGVGKGNVISGNANYGIALSGTGTSLNTVQGNLIGLNAAGTAGIPNSFSGVIVFNAAQNNFIGSSALGAGNMIAFNNFAGIDVFDSTTIGNDFNANSIFSNGGLGINLVGGSENGFGVTANDPQDPDLGPNQLQNFPVLTFANSAVVIQGSLNSVPSKPYRVDFFSSPVADASGFGEGQTWIGAVNVTTDGSGNASFNMDFPGSLTTGSKVTATATGTGTGASGTSEFSAVITVVP